ncbi:ChbG/HpnK family deacetylase [Cohnella endophytica]|uniref:ChbG/HpnK family deacetylase n=1 Tax=Cohnella endophytica TaxID=2419778 RepID=A0A494Y2G3_9BACL|nr:polysaccharide deacetylase family protein [Cohnella endophytica]RKP56889.1 ChbG/HpnK family deacetylase [Cohnella endophytica]
MNTAQRLGYGSKERLLIVNADDFGLCRSVNEAVSELLADRAISSATIMMNCPWSADAVNMHMASCPEADVGVHWTLTSEWTAYKWGSICRNHSTASLSGPGGWFPKTSAEVERNADSEEVRQELIAQTEAALSAGVKLSHADSHMGSLYGFHLGKDLLTVAFDVCARYGLPFRLPRRLIPVGGRTIPAEIGDRAKIRVRQAEDRGIVLPDYVTGPEYSLSEGDTYETMKEEGIGLLRQLLPGVTEWISHPSKLTEELRSFHEQPEKREMEARFWRDRDVRETVVRENIRFIGWKELQELQMSLSV